MSLPSGYKLLEYIQSTGTQCINTELAESSVYGIRMKFTVPSLNVSWQSLVSGTLDTGFTVGSTTKTTGLYVRLRGDEVLKKDTALSSSVNELVIKGGKISINGAQVATYTAGALSSGSGQFYVFNNNAKSRYSNMFLYELELYDSSGATVRKYVASKRNSNNAIGMYDLVSNTFYGNAGTGTFTAGPVKEPPAAPTNLHHLLAVRLAWSAVDGATGYNVYRDDVLLASTTETTFIDLTASENTEYTYSVSAVNSTGGSSKTTITVYTKSGYFLYKPYIESATFQ